ncbi:GAF domain-containing protein [Haloplanus sp. C73]|uniref:sensor histidine kinase n=1 Tax=Haloplanus sp. C73 TaxID=3421641 RepID=UPI003EB72CB0
MERLSAKAGGTAIAIVGLGLAAVQVESAVRFRTQPALVLVEVVIPLVVSLVVAAVGALIRAERLAPPQFVGRVLTWSGVGAVALSAAIGWLFLSASVRGEPVPHGTELVLDAATMGVLVGLVVGVYDARSASQHARAEQLTRINDTLRIATREIVESPDRAALERAVCERLTDSAIYDQAWIGRYVPEEDVVKPVAWSGHDDAYMESLHVTTDPDESSGRGPGGEAIRTGDIQIVHDVYVESSLEPWHDMLAEAGVESIAVVPLVGTEHVYGFLSMYANRPNVFDAQEQDALTDLGESIGHAIDAMAAQERLSQREQELARQNKRLDEFASVISHDLRNPLNVAQGNVDLARTTGNEQYLDQVDDALDRMDELVDDLLTLARYGRTVSDTERLDIQTVAENAWTTTATDGARLRFDGDPGSIRADGSRLTQLFENLFRNSVEHGSTNNRHAERADDSVEHGSTDSRTESGDDTPPVTITVGEMDDGFYVADDGPGIPEDERETVFETGYSTTADGTGFGLNIVRNIAESHGWSVAITESEDGGARFEFTTDAGDATAR